MPSSILKKTIQVLAARIAEQDIALAEKNSIITEKDRVITALKAEIDRLKERGPQSGL